MVALNLFTIIVVMITCCCQSGIFGLTAFYSPRNVTGDNFCFFSWATEAVTCAPTRSSAVFTPTLFRLDGKEVISLF